MDRIYPKPPFEFYDSSDSDSESKNTQSPSRGESSSSNWQPSTRIPDSNRRVHFNVPTEPTLQRSTGSRQEVMEIYSLEQELDKAKLHINQAAADLVKMGQSYSTMVKEYVGKGEIPPALISKYKLDELDVPEVIKRYKDTLADR
ncbi:hypothetical protein [Herbaspirillum huttiense]|uniref:Uncharacterized protein n=2 Tax=Herbaspirillum huttiense TaxID=863372 RepID=A0AAJ2LYW1_9BURK|nr:hypothetical protein [Herbaspirillum huttiense]MDR9839838.1 hypothetical protein [Herbaspirillum huttiense]